MASLRKTRRVWLDSLKEGKPCSKCEMIFPPYVMDWHHRNRADKKFGINRAIHKTSQELILKEIAKCDLLCANCHRIVEHKAR